MPLLDTPGQSLRPDAWSPNQAHCRVQYQLLADIEADILCRVLNHFALQFLIPQRVSVQQQESTLQVEVELDGLSWHRAGVIADKLRNLISVSSVELAMVEPSRLQAAG
ncbi:MULTISPECIES: hypothetical protein [Pseudomonas]|uniref:DUF1652 domain-containing protein n=1 Tax=Pseudomonas sessilinigenes TaxID=658629 RepID=A0ABX8MR12_9PSED|nr:MULTISPECIES: hypothetical protein [Pseudomonas]AZC25385.1 hypothetical protein C4K39_3717 [Pseudomonas sessilinigenes]QIH11634.1 hypothetical protein ATY02_35200 [Pseudomonas sp. BIOMIG1BAC]QXH40556.1 hypothetical protein KSS89_30845 [Pseudomonas sessilinigenes]